MIDQEEIAKQIKALIDHLLDAWEEENTEDRYCDIRLQYFEDRATLHTGDPCYDLDHRGHWGCSSITPEFCDPNEIAKDLIEQVEYDQEICREIEEEGKQL